MFNFFKNIFTKRTDIDELDDKEISESEHETFIWCLVGNIVSDNIGTKHFSPNTKIYCFPPKWGDGYEHIKVIGSHRKSSRKIFIIMSSKSVTNWRLQKIYNPHILNIMKSKKGWTDSENDKETILKMIESIIENKLDKN